MRKLANALARFMYGRNGADRLGRAMLWLYVGLCVLRVAAASLLHSRPLYVALGVLEWAVAAVVLFRMFSRDLPRRQAEDRRWTEWTQRSRRRRQGALERHNDKDHKYFTCKDCKAVCRVPVGKGNIEITCPRCGAKIRART